MSFDVNEFLRTYAWAEDEHHQHIDDEQAKIFLLGPHLYPQEMDDLEYIAAAGVARGCGHCMLKLSYDRTSTPLPDNWHNEVYDDA